MQHPPVAISHKPIASPGVYNQHVDKKSYMPPHSNAELKYQQQQAQRQVNLQHPPVAISCRPIASPGVYNQHVDERSYMPPHSNAELKYQEKQPQRQMNLQQQITARGATNVNAFNSTQTPPVIPHAQRYPTAQQTSASAYENEAAVVGIPVSAVGKPIPVPRSHNPRNTSQLRAPVLSRNSAGELGPLLQIYPDTESEPNTDGNGVLMRHLNENILDTVAEVNENERIGDTRQIDSDLESIPQDPNLQCIVCGKIFKIGQIQNFKRHVATCAGND